MHVSSPGSNPGLSARHSPGGVPIRRRIRGVALSLLAVGLLAGCVERKVVIRSDPPKTDVYLDGRRIGQTPIEEGFTWYGSRHLLFMRPGHRPHSTTISLKPPLYEIPPIDIVSEILLPWTLVDRHHVAVTLEPAKEEDPSSILERAEAYRGAD